jgi:hypothetical protein
MIYDFKENLVPNHREQIMGSRSFEFYNLMYYSNILGGLETEWGFDVLRLS